MIFPTRIELSTGKHIPVLKVYRRTFYPHQFFHRMIAFRRWRLLQRDPPIVVINDQILTLSKRYFDTLFGEWLSWETVYTPRFSLKGMRVLDVGAGCGETALFFLTQGVKKVICVEPDRSNVEMLRRNASRNGWNAEVIFGGFNREMLEWEFDYMKMDCEGCERELVGVDYLPPCSIEVHDPETYKKLVEMYGLRTVARDRRGTWIIQSTWDPSERFRGKRSTNLAT